MCTYVCIMHCLLCNAFTSAVYVRNYYANKCIEVDCVFAHADGPRLFHCMIMHVSAAYGGQLS